MPITFERFILNCVMTTVSSERVAVVELCVGGEKVFGCLDSGASANFVSKAVAERVLRSGASDVTLSRTPMSVRLGNGTLGSSQMCGTMPCVVDGQCVHALGWPFMLEHGVVLDPARGMMWMR